MSSTTETTPDTALSEEAAGTGRRTPRAKTACIRTFGCQMNVHDSDRMQAHDPGRRLRRGRSATRTPTS